MNFTHNPPPPVKRPIPTYIIMCLKVKNVHSLNKIVIKYLKMGCRISGKKEVSYCPYVEYNHTVGVMVSEAASSLSGIKIVFEAAPLRRKNKQDWFPTSNGNVSKWSDMSTYGSVCWSSTKLASSSDLPYLQNCSHIVINKNHSLARHNLIETNLSVLTEKLLT